MIFNLTKVVVVSNVSIKSLSLLALPSGCLFYWPFQGSGPSITLCCFVIYCTWRFVLKLAFCYFVLVFFNPFGIAITSLWEEKANVSAFCTSV